MNILYEDDCILVCEKPAGVPTQTAKISEKDMVSEVNNYLLIKAKRASQKACPAFLIHRLDRPVSGILVFAKTKQAASVLNKQLQDGLFDKRYFALVSGIVENNQTEDAVHLVDYILKDSKNNKAVITGKDNKESKKAELIYKVVTGLKPFKLSITNQDDYYNGNTLLDIKLLTGRFHQIRAQLSNIGHPIVGDEKYGGNTLLSKNTIFLMAYKLSFFHPVTGNQLTFDISSIKR